MKIKKKKQVDTLEKLKPKEKTRPVEDKLNNRSRTTIIFNDLINKRKELMNKLYDSVDYNSLKFGRKTLEKEKIIDNLERFYISREEVINFFRDLTEMLSDANYKAKQNETKGKGLKILTPKQMLQRLPTALAQVKAGNNSENLLNEMRQIIYSLYQSKEITKKVYNNLMKFL